MSVLGIIVGTMPHRRSGAAATGRSSGLAGGPLVVALVLGRSADVSGASCSTCHVTTNLAALPVWHRAVFRRGRVGGGADVFGAVFSPAGVQWLGVGLCVTVVPLLLAGILARVVLHMNSAGARRPVLPAA